MKVLLNRHLIYIYTIDQKYMDIKRNSRIIILQRNILYLLGIQNFAY